MKVLGLTSWQGVVTVIMLRGSFPCDDDNEDDYDLIAFTSDIVHAHGRDVIDWAWL